jgi:4-amino-4-deoxy-L-arabinose transferase-like glycosyltransferase
MALAPKTGHRFLVAAAAALALVLVVADLFAAHGLTLSDQGKQAQYLLDVVDNGNWLAPWDQARGEPATKPPLYTWCAAASSALLGGPGEMALRLPAAVSALGLVLATFLLGRRFGDTRTGAWAAIVLVTITHFGRMAVLARTDGLLACLLAFQLVVHAYAADPRRVSAARMLALSVLCAAACLTKGPAGWFACLVSALWLWMTRRRAGILRAAMVPALLGGLALGGWFLLAWRTGGDAIWTTMIDGELRRHATSGQWWNPLYYVPVLIARILPWTLLLPAAIVDAVRARRYARPGPVPDDVALPVAWLIGHVVFFALIAHKRPDLAYPGEPGLCLLVGRVAAVRVGRATAIVEAVVFAVCAPLLLFFWSDHLAVPAPTSVLVLGSVCFACAALLAAHPATRARAGGLFVPTAFAGVAVFAALNLALSPQAAAWSWARFGEVARAEAARLDAPILHTGFGASVPLYHLGIARRPAEDAELLAAPRPFLLVAAPEMQGRLTKLLGPLEELERFAGQPDTADAELVVFRVLAP